MPSDTHSVRWVRLPLNLDPGRRGSKESHHLYDHASVLRGSQLWVFGGRNLPLHDVHFLDLETLQRNRVPSRVVSGLTLPVSLRGHTVISPNGQYAVLFGGEDCKTRTPSNSLLKFDFETRTWSLIKPRTEKAPGPRLWHTAIYNPFRNSMVVFGGANGYLGSTLADLWEFDFEHLQWNEIVVRGEIGARCVHRAVLDVTRRQMIVIGGGSYESKFNDIYTINLETYGAWQRMSCPVGPPKMCRHSLVIDSEDRVIMFGGESSDKKFGQDVWILNPDQQTWSPTTHSGTVPPATEGHTACSYGGSMYILGGVSNKLNEVWVCIAGGSLKKDISALFDPFG